MNSPPFLTPKAKDQDRAASGRMCLLVLGMHRSGTSAITRVLSIAGAKLPASLMGAGRGNEVGHWESVALATYDDQLLEQLDSRWGDWRALEIGRLPLKRRRDIKAEIGDLLAAEFGDAGLFVVKDPRICRFAPLFIEALDDAGIDPRIVHMVRNPLEVAGSLEHRDKVTRTDAALQWLRHVLDSEAATRARSRVIVSYAALLKDWRTTLERITEALRVAWPYSIDDIAGQVVQFLDRGQRHHTHTVEDVLLDSALRDWMGEAYSALLVLESNPGSKAAMTTLDKIRREFNHAAPILHGLLADAQSAWDKQRTAVLVEREQEASSLKATLGEAEARSVQLTAALEERDKRIAGLVPLTAALDERDKRIAGLVPLAAALEERDERITGLGAALAAKTAEARQLAASSVEREQVISGLKAALSAAKTRATQITATLEEREKRIAGLGAALAEKNREVEQIAAGLAEREAEAASLRATLGASEKEAAEMHSLAERRSKRLESEKQVLLQQANLDRHELINHFRSSTSWKVTRPLRALKRFLPNSPFRLRRPNLLVRATKSPNDAASIIANSGLFNEQYYLSLVRDEKIRDPIGHYLQHGHKRGLDPNPLFDADYYTTLYAAHLDESTNPFVHFIQSGSGRGFDPSRLFQTAYYRDSNLDVQGSGVIPLLHYLKFGRVEGYLPIDVAPSDHNSLALQVHGLDLTNPHSYQFNPDLYAALYPEIVEAPGRDDGALVRHYEVRGRAEGRIASLGAFLKALNMPPEAVPINFDESEYYELNADLGSALPHTFFHAVRHYLEFGIRERRRYSYSQCYIDAPWLPAAKAVPAAAPRVPEARRKVACLVHVCHSELWPSLLRNIRNLDSSPRDVFVSVIDTVWSEELHAQIRSDVPDAGIVVSESRGREIVRSYMNCLAGVQIDDYGAFFLVSTKQARGVSQNSAENCRSSRLEPMILTGEQLAGNLALLESDPSIGIISAGGAPQNRVNSDVGHYNGQPHRSGSDRVDASIDYLSGGAMLVRPKVLKRIYEVASGAYCEDADGPDIDGIRHGQLEQSGGRLFADVCSSLGCRVHWN